jgi:predicted nucleotidyltransferase
MIYLTTDELKIVINIITTFIPQRKIIVFGSRSMGSVKKFSDLDLCIMGDEPLSLVEEATLREAFSESNLSFRVDIVSWANLEQEFQTIIIEQGQNLV